MDSIRLFLRSNSFRKSKKRNSLKYQYVRTSSNPGEINDLTIENQSDQSSSSEKIKSFLSTHPCSTTASLTAFPKPHFELETCSGLSIPITEQPVNTLIAASASESISNARSFTNHHRRRSSILRNKRRRSCTAVHNHQHKLPLSPSIRRTNSYRYSDRIRKHPKENRIRRPSQVNS
jgi:hypothetical protein